MAEYPTLVTLVYHCPPVSVPLYTVVHHFTPLGRVVKKVDNAIHRINDYPADIVVYFVNTYPLDG